MNLKAEVELKNNQLILRNAALEQQLRARTRTSDFGSLLVTFVAAPFIVGLAAQRVLGSDRSESRKFLPGWGLLSLL